MALTHPISNAMFTPKWAALTILLLISQAPESAYAGGRDAVYEQMLDFRSLVKGGSIDPHWMKDGQSFWYTEGTPADRHFIKVDPQKNTVSPMFEVARLRSVLTSTLGHEPARPGIPFDTFDSLEGNTIVGVAVDGRYFRIDLATYKITPQSSPVVPPQAAAAEPVVYQYGSRDVPAPGGASSALYKDFNIWLRSADGGAAALTSNGTDRYHWSLRSFSWSPDSRLLFVTRVDWRNTHFTPIVDWMKPNQVEISYSPYPSPGGNMGRVELHILDPASKNDLRIDAGEEEGDQLWPIGWCPDGSEVLFMRTDRLMKRLDLMAANPKTGRSRVILTDTSKTFIERIIPITDNLFYPLSGYSRFIWRSERDGWGDLYLYEMSGKLIRRLTSKTGPVQRIVAIDEPGGWIYYLASGDSKRPYDVHVYRVRLDGSQASRLTKASGIHVPMFSPNNRYFIDTHSSVDRPPVVELRVSDGTEIRELERTDISTLTALGWRSPEEFTVKAADGTTDLYGVLYKPHNFDPNSHYPVVDLAYPGNWSHQVPNSFVGTWLGDEAQALTQLGFIVCITDGRGTAGRGKAFQDLAYRHIGEISVSDHVAVLRNLAHDRPFMDLERVGVTGYSWGGWFSIQALLKAPEFFKVGVAGAPVVELLGLETFLGMPEENEALYNAMSNLPIAGNLRGKLLMVTSTSDPGAPFGSAMRMAEAFIKAGKHFDLLIFPGEHHALSPIAMSYYIEARNHYLVEHLRPEK